MAFSVIIHAMPLYFRKYRHFIVGGIALAAVSVAAFYFLDYRSVKDEISGVTKDTAPGIEDTAVDSGTLQPEPRPAIPPSAKALMPYQGQPIRELNADPKFIASIGSALHEKYRKNLASLAERLEKDPLNHDDWLAVAYIKKLFSNYIGTRDAWEYAKIVKPDSAVPYFNLGGLYGYELKEPAKAEENYVSALRLDPYNLDYYVGLANFYADVLKNPTASEATLLSALDKVPHTEVNLFTQIGSFYSNHKNYAKAVEYFEKALDAATNTNPDVKKAVENELNYLRSKQ